MSVSHIAYTLPTREYLGYDPTTKKFGEVKIANNGPSTIDLTDIRVAPGGISYNTSTGLNELVLYNSQGQITTGDSPTPNYSYNSNVSDSAQDSILQDIDPSFPVYTPKTVQIPQGGESLTEYDQQSSIIDAENEKSKDAYKTALLQYDGNATPIADSMLSYLQTLQRNSDPKIAGVASNGLEAIPGGDGNYLAESVVAYNKAKTQIEQTYSDGSIAKRAKEQGITDVDSYTQQQQTAKAAEIQKLNLDYSDATGTNISRQTYDLNTFFNSPTGLSFNDPNAQAIGSSLTDMEKQLFSLYDQFDQQNNVDYSSESVQKIAQQFAAYGVKNVTATLSIGGTSFTYHDIVSTGEVLSDARVNSSDFGNTTGQFHAALGASEVSYVASHNMTAAAGQLLSKKYNEHLQYQENITYGSFGMQVNDVPGYFGMKKLNANNAESFRNSFQSVLQTQFRDNPAGSNKEKLHSIFNTFADQFLE